MLLADYVVLIDDDFRLRKDTDVKKDLPFTLPPDVVLDSPAVLTFTVNPQAGQISFATLLNSSQEAGARYQTREFCSLHEVVSGLQAGANTMTFEYQDGDGSIFVGDVVLLFKREVL